MIDIKNLTIKLKDERIIIDGLNITIKQGDKLAIVGEEGNGKSTLVKTIYDRALVENYAYVEGHVDINDNKISYLEQSLNADWNNQTVLDFLIKNKPNDVPDYDIYRDIDIIEKNLRMFKVNPLMLEDAQKIGSLSGGEKVKIQLVKILLQNPDVVILDEPTNDIDLDTLKWLEGFINDISIPVIFISHDETMLEKCANAILHIEQIIKKTKNKITFERMGYIEYVNKRALLLDRQEQIANKERENYEEKNNKWQRIYNRVKHEQETISRNDPQGARLLKKKMKSVKAQQYRFEKEKANFTDVPDKEGQINAIFSSNAIHSKKTVLDYTLDNLKIGNRSLSKDIKIRIQGPQKVVIIGKNGVGKTTLIKLIYSQLKQEKDLVVGYMPQNYDDEFSGTKTVLEYILDICQNKEEITRVRTLLGSMKFISKELDIPLNNLSGGQKAKLFLAKLVFLGADVLILDEPTRNLSPLSNPLIRKRLKEFNGAIISISHDRKYIKEVCDLAYELTSSTLISINSNKI